MATEAKHDLAVDHTQVARRYSVRLGKPAPIEDDPDVLEAEGHWLVSSMIGSALAILRLPAPASAVDTPYWSRSLVLRL